MFHQRALDYIDDVISGKELVCVYIRQAVERHVSDLKDTKSGFYFDDRTAQMYLEAAKLFKHSSGDYARTPFNLLPFQCFALYCLFGWKRKDTRKRRFKRVYWETAKKSGKSEIAALIGLLCALLDKEDGAQIYSVATKREQAMHVFRPMLTMAKRLREDSHALRRMINANARRIYIEETETFIEPLPADSRSMDGINPQFSAVDEYHAHPTSYVSDIHLNAMVMRSQPIHFIITTAGFNLQGPCYRITRDEAVKMLNGTITADDLFSLIFTLDEGDDWKDPALWPKANPSIGRTVRIENMMDLFNKALNTGPTAEVDFKTKNLNMWVHSKLSWVKDEVFLECKGEVDIKDQAARGVMCWGGMDLGQTRDLTCVAFLFDPEMNGGKYLFKLYTWTCQEALEVAISRGYPYNEWQRDGWLNVTPGNTTDYGYARNELNAFRNEIQIYDIGYDISNSTQIVIDLTNDGFNMLKFSQAIQNMNTPTRTLEELFHSRSVVHDGNDLMRYMFQNVEIVRDSTGNIKVSKKDPDKKVDGVVAMVMALGQYMEYQRTVGGMYSEGVRFM